MRKSSPVERIRLLGRSGIDVVQALGRSSLFLFSSLFGRSGLSNGGQLLIRQLYFVGVLSLPIIVVAGLFIGMVLALQGFNILSSYGSEQAVGQMVALTLLRELGPVVTGLLFAGRAGSALTAEIGNMKSTEQLSSLQFRNNVLERARGPPDFPPFFCIPLLSAILWGRHYASEGPVQASAEEKPATHSEIITSNDPTYIYGTMWSLTLGKDHG